MEEEAGEKAYLQDTDHDGSAHEMGRLVKHFSAVHGPDACVDTDMDDQERNQKNARKTHYEFFAYGRSKEFRPVHALLFFQWRVIEDSGQPRKFSTGMVAKLFSFTFFAAERTGQP
jgi:hypothetical protein